MANREIMLKKIIQNLSTWLLLLFLPPIATAQNLTINRVDSQPVIDGSVGNEEWSKATKTKLHVETTPGENVSPSVQTDVLLMEDGAFLYVAFIAHDPDVDKIRAYYSDHDMLGGHDSVGIVLDTFNDERQAFEFFVNPLGVQRDLINDDINKRHDPAWDALWESAGKINDSNYSVEMAIPLNQLRFKNAQAEQTWGIDLVRLYPRDRFTRMGANELDRGVNCYLCQLKKANGFEALQSRLNLTLTPSITGNVTETRDLPDEPNWVREDFDPDAGFDLRWGINQSLYLNATVNPDFSQVEADNAQLAVNTTFSLFFPERRTFFLDGANYFNSRLNLVHTRNIAEPDYGVKLTGKNSGHSYGVLAARDTVTSFIAPGNQGSELVTLDDTESDVFAARYRYDIGNDYTIGVIATDRRANDYANSVMGFDGIFQLSESDRVEFLALYSDSENPESVQAEDEQNLAAQQDDRAFTMQYRHDDRRWHWFARYDDFGEDFRADLGFINRVDFNKREIGGGHLWYPTQLPYKRIRFSSNWDKSYNQSGKELEEELEAVVGFGDGPKQSFIDVGGGIRDRFYDDEYFDESWVYFVAGLRPVPELFTFFFTEHAKVIDFENTRLGDIQTYEIEFNYRIGRHIQTSGEVRHQRFTVDNGVLFKTNIFDVKATYQFNARSFLRFTTQFTNVERNIDLYLDPDDGLDQTDKTISTQLLYSYKINAQSRFFLGYSDAGFQDDQYSSIKKTTRTFFVKATYAWQP